MADIVLASNTAAKTSGTNVNSTVPGAGQSFTSPAFKSKIKALDLWSKKGGSPTGSCYAKLYAHSGTYGTSSKPTGAALATSDAVNSAGISTSEGWITFTFSGVNQIILLADTYYVLTLEFTGGDGSNYVFFGKSGDEVTGNACYYISSWNASASTDGLFELRGEETDILISGNLTGAGILSASLIVEKFISGAFGGIGTLSVNNLKIISTIYFLELPQITKDTMIATHVTVKSPTNEVTVHITPEPDPGDRIERIVNIDSGNSTVCTAVGNELLIKWGKEQINIRGKIPLTVTLTFMQKLSVYVKQANISTNLVLQKKEHDVLDASTTVTMGDIQLSDDELVSRIFEDLLNK